MRTNGFLTLQSQDFGSSQFVGVNVSARHVRHRRRAPSAGTAASRSAGTDIVATINGEQAVGSGLTASVSEPDAAGSITFNAADNVANTTAAITVTGGGSVFQIGQQANLSGQINLGIPAVNTAVARRNRRQALPTRLGRLSEPGERRSDRSGLDAGRRSSMTRINQVSTLSGEIGALQANVINTNIATLNSALENVSQAQSDIEDTNFAQETANMTRAQILEQAGISVLAIANQTPSDRPQALKLIRVAWPFAGVRSEN